MSKIEELIEKLCPNGVEYKKLDEVCNFNRGTSMTSKNAIEGDVPVISGGQKPAFYIMHPIVQLVLLRLQVQVHMQDMLLFG